VIERRLKPFDVRTDPNRIKLGMKAKRNGVSTVMLINFSLKICREIKPLITYLKCPKLL
jgi:hypothetical protein